METGDCRLCLAPGVELQNSHILPKWTYRRAFDKTQANGSGNPIMMTNDVVIQTSAQAAEPMLCFDCEQRLGRDEDYVSRLAYQEGGTLGLLNTVSTLAVVEFCAETLGMTVRGASIAALDCQALSRFAASVFWRAHVARLYMAVDAVCDRAKKSGKNRVEAVVVPEATVLPEAT